jgi:diguanylate cyclase (GGDEF)-like protein
LSDDRVRVIRETRDGFIWVGTYENGLDRFDRATQRFTHFSQDTPGPGPLVGGNVRDVYEDSSGALWVATDDGLSRWISDARGFANFANDPAEPASLSDDRVNTVVEDAGGLLWVATHNGLNKWNLATGAFELYRRNPDAADGLGSDVVNAFTEDARGNIWIGTYGGGLTRMDAETGNMTRFGHDPDDPSSLSDDKVMALYADAADHIWIGTFEMGLDRFDPHTGRFHHYRHDPDDPTSLSANGVTAIAADEFGALWIGTYRGGLNQLDPDAQTFARYQHDPDNPNSLGSDSVLALHHDDTGAVWIGTDGAGLSRFDRQSGTFSHFGHDPNDPTSLSSDLAWTIHEDRDGGLWIGTQFASLNYWEPTNRRELNPVFRRYGRSDGLRSPAVYGVLEDDTQDLWLSTSRGITRLTPSTGRTKTYDVTHGLQGNNFMFAAYFRSRDGRMFFGGANGFNIFRPDLVEDNEHVPPVVLTKFLKFNRAFAWEGAGNGDPMTLSYQDSVIGFEFAALDFTAPDQNQYRYRLEGFESEWNDVGDVRRATYTNLEAGEYTLRVQGSNNDGVWNEEGLSLALVVGPPPWLSGWAILVYTVLGIGTVAKLVRPQRRKREHQADYRHRLEREVRARTDELASQNRELAGLNTRLQEVSVTDSLTGLWNRRYLANEIPKDLARIRRARINHRDAAPDDPRQMDTTLLFVMLDLDGLKGVNDTYGHQAGDRVIVETKELLTQVCRETDTLIRWGGDEFLLVGRQADTHIAAGLADRLRRAVESHRFELGNGDTVGLSCSVGFSFYPFIQRAPTLFTWDRFSTWPIGRSTAPSRVVGTNGSGWWAHTTPTRSSRGDARMRTSIHSPSTVFSRSTPGARTPPHRITPTARATHHPRHGRSSARADPTPTHLPTGGHGGRESGNGRP